MRSVLERTTTRIDFRNEWLEGERGWRPGRAREIDDVGCREAGELPERRGLGDEHRARAARDQCRVEEPKRMADVAVIRGGSSVRRCCGDVMGVVVVMDENQVAVRVITTRVSPVERAAAHDQCQQGCESPA